MTWRRSGAGNASPVPTLSPSRPPGTGHPPAHFPIVRGSAIDGHGWSAGDTRNRMKLKKLEVVARDGQIRRERIWTCAACPQGEGHGRPESINHRHADFQDDGKPGLVRESRSSRTSFRRADRTAPPDRAYSEPESAIPSAPEQSPMPVNGLRASRPNHARTGRPRGVESQPDYLASGCP